MDDKPEIDLEKLKEYQDQKKKKEEAEKNPPTAPHPSLTNPYYPYQKRGPYDDLDDWT